MHTLDITVRFIETELGTWVPGIAGGRGESVFHGDRVPLGNDGKLYNWMWVCVF